MCLPAACPCTLLPCLPLLQGYLVGNGCTDPQFDGNAQVPFALGKSLISASLYARTREACKGKFYDAPAGSR
jgi:serine carboxypeptidase-like clade 1